MYEFLMWIWCVVDHEIYLRLPLWEENLEMFAMKEEPWEDEDSDRRFLKPSRATVRIFIDNNQTERSSDERDERNL